MGPKRRQQLLLGVLLVALAVLVYVRWPWPGTTPPSTPAVAGNRSPVAREAAVAPQTLDVHLDALDRERPQPGAVTRDLFRFAPKTPPPAVRSTTPPAAPAPARPPQPPPAPPIPLRFIGLLEPRGGEKIAVLSDGRGTPLYGKEGGTVLGQYKILRIGTESIEVSSLDGRGRQTIRLSGS
ncbi:MAG: hypothetical protein LBQ09_03980 [Acidobacteriaceae bacterium]|jgi:hypothetical protein|nr:hypothetical protein [Acidobacteriaceae bacterium]